MRVRPGEDEEYVYALNKATEFSEINYEQARRSLVNLKENSSDLIKKRDIFPEVISNDTTTDKKIFMDARVWWKNFTHQKQDFLNKRNQPDSLTLLKKTKDLTNVIFFPELADKTTEQAKTTISKLLAEYNPIIHNNEITTENLNGEDAVDETNKFSSEIPLNNDSTITNIGEEKESVVNEFLENNNSQINTTENTVAKNTESDFLQETKSELKEISEKDQTLEDPELKKMISEASKKHEYTKLKKFYNHLLHELNRLEAATMAHEEQFPLPAFVPPPAASAAFRQYFIDTLLHKGYLQQMGEVIEVYKKNQGILFLPGPPAQIYPHVFNDFNTIFEERNAWGATATLKELWLQDKATSLWTKAVPYRRFLKIAGGDVIEHAWIREQRFGMFHNYPYIWELWFWQIVVFILPIISFLYYFGVEEHFDFDRYKLLSIMDKQENKLTEKITKLL